MEAESLAYMYMYMICDEISTYLQVCYRYALVMLLQNPRERAQGYAIL